MFVRARKVDDSSLGSCEPAKDEVTTKVLPFI